MQSIILEANFSMLAEANQIFRNDFDCIHYHICEICTQIVAPNHELCNNTLYLRFEHTVDIKIIRPPRRIVA